LKILTQGISAKEVNHKNTSLRLGGGDYTPLEPSTIGKSSEIRQGCPLTNGMNIGFFILNEE
jgi:hypothetical protein